MQLAENAIAARRDIFTMDTLAWAYFKVGRLADARKASEQALRTGTKDARILYHRAEILAAAGDRSGALQTWAQIPSPHAITDVLMARAAADLRASLSQ